MRILNFKDFNNLPAGTIFAKYTNTHIGELAIKIGCKDGKIVYRNLTTEPKLKTGDYVKEITEASRDSSISLAMCFRTVSYMIDSPKQHYVVYEKADIVGLINTLTDTLGGYIESNMINFKPRYKVALKNVKEMIIKGDKFFEISYDLFRNVEYPIGDTGIDFNYLSTFYPMDKYFRECTIDEVIEIKQTLLLTNK